MGGSGGGGDGTFTLRVMRVLKNWVNDFGYDFEGEEGEGEVEEEEEEEKEEGGSSSLLEQLTHFCTQIEESHKKNAVTHSAIVRKSIQKITKTATERLQSELFSGEEGGGGGGGGFPFNDLLLWGKVEVATFAGQITLHNFSTYSKITPKEIMHYVKVSGRGG